MLTRSVFAATLRIIMASMPRCLSMALEMRDILHDVLKSGSLVIRAIFIPGCQRIAATTLSHGKVQSPFFRFIGIR